jgi:TRAP-type C4-dicarboxylate transport system substrate-binding protein
MNLKTWNKLTSHLQDLVMTSFIEGEKNAMGKQGQTEQALRTKIAKSGVEFYKLSPDMADWYLKTAYESAWAYQQKRFPDVTPKLKQLLSK